MPPRRLLAIAVSSAALLVATLGCTALNPRPLEAQARLAQFPTSDLPLERPVTVRWNAFQVPFIEAESDRDLAFTLGLVHNHLRMAQIAMLKRIAQGRLAEGVGPLATDIDHALRILDYPRGARAMMANLPAETRDWLDAYVAGLNHYQHAVGARPPEFGLLGLEAEPWTVEDVLSIGRLAGTDVNWVAYFALLAKRGEPGFPEAWRRVRVAGINAAAAWRDTAEQRMFADLLGGLSKSGSNSVAVAPSRSASGHALLANDPHLGLTLPNLWVLAGMKSPGFHVVGLMVPGVPMVAVGRNPDLAWGGTNMRAASSDLVDVSGLPDDAFEQRSVAIGTRGWFDSERTVRLSPYGPVMTDADIVPDGGAAAIALRWVGHSGTDELTAMLAAARATDVDGFRRALAGFGVSAQNMVAADRNGDIAHILAATLPDRDGFPADDPVLAPAEADRLWSRQLGPLDLPWRRNPDDGWIASANNRPRFTDTRLGFLYSDDDRVLRLEQMLRADGSISVDDLRDLQTDTRSPKAAVLAAGLAQRLAAGPAAAAEPAFVRRLADWDGNYAVDSPGAVAFETLLYHLLPAIHGADDPSDLDRLHTQWSDITTFLLHDLDALPATRRDEVLAGAAAAAARDAGRFATWGDMHKLKVRHVLANVPVLGRFFEYDSFPVGGSRETPMKTAHGLVNDEHGAFYGSQSRHISDMGDPDANWFLVFGGQDGWMGSENFDDQVALWRERRYIRLPLTAAAVAEAHPTVQRLSPRRRD